MDNVKKESQFVILQDGLHLSVTQDELQQQMAPIAQPADYVNAISGIPGLMYPGDGIIYDRETGELKVDVPRIPVFRGLIGSEPEMVRVPSGKEVFDDYYVVAEVGFTLGNSWGELDGVTPNLNDQVVCGDENKGQDKWYIVPDFMGEAAVLEVISNTPALVVDSTDNQRPKLTIDDVVPYVDPINVGVSGLMPPDFASNVRDLEDTYIKQDVLSYPHISEAP